MSDLGAIFHVKKAGVQYDAHASTTTDECPEPNLKIKFKGAPAYIKLEAKGNGDVPCYVKKKNGEVFQVKKEAFTPTGSVSVGAGDMFSVPPGVRVIRVFWREDEYDDTSHSEYTYVGVTPGKKYELQCYTFIIWPNGDPVNEVADGVYLGSRSKPTIKIWFQRIPPEDIQDTKDISGFELSWSPEINKMKPTYTDY